MTTAGVSQPFIRRSKEAMKCSELQFDLSLHADGFLAENDVALVRGHLEICPLCRQKYSEIREIKTGLRRVSHPEISPALHNRLMRTVKTELGVFQKSRPAMSTEMRSWLQISVMPYGVGVLASLVFGFTFLAMMFSANHGLSPLSAASPNPYRSDPVMLAANPDPFRDGSPGSLSASDYAQSRLSISSESPSINPQGALIALTKSLVRGGMKDDEVVVVADIFSNGLAQIAEVVEPSRDRQAVYELQKALDSDPAYAPFVASNLDRRSDNVRVVLKFRSVSVSTGLSRHRR